MKGLELAERFFEDVVAPALEERFPSLTKRYAAGLIGFGSDVLGHDDDFSRDHEWGPRCILWLQEADFRRHADSLRRMLDGELPPEFLGFRARFRRVPALGMIPSRKGIPNILMTTVSRYTKQHFGLGRLPRTRLAWLCIPEQKLLEFTEGRLFRDPGRRLTHLRQAVAYLPDDVWRFKMLYAWDCLRWHLDVIGLCAARGEPLSAHLLLQRTLERLIRLTFLLSRRYCPGTLKWVGRELKSLPLGKRISPLLQSLIGLHQPQESRASIQSMIGLLVDEHNRLQITPKVRLMGPDLCARGQVCFSVRDVVSKLNQSLPPYFRRLTIQGACDQWITNDDALMEPRQFTKFKKLYQ